MHSFFGIAELLCCIVFWGIGFIAWGGMDKLYFCSENEYSPDLWKIILF